MKRLFLLFFVLITAGCSCDSETSSFADTDSDSDTNTDGDSNSDSDTDTDGDSDTDTDGDTDSDSESDTDTTTSTDSDSDSDSDTDSDSDSGIDAGTDTDTDTDTPIDLEKEFPPVEDWHLTISTDEDGGTWDEWVDEADTITSEEIYDPDTIKDKFFPCTLTANSVDYGNCEVRLTGESSLTFPKKSVRVKFMKNVEHPGFSRKMSLRSEWNDPSFMRNALGYFLFRNLTEIPTPRTKFIRLYINSEYHGLMVYPERIGGRFLEENERNRNSSMYEIDPHLWVISMGAGSLIPLDESDTDTPNYTDVYDKKTADESDIDETDYTDLIAFIEDVIWQDFQDGTTTRIREYVDMDSFIDYMAVMALLQSWDNVQKNIYFSWQQPKDADSPRWEFYPWDLDLTFGCIYNISNKDTICEPGNLFSDGMWFAGMHQEDIDPFYGDLLFYNLLIHTVLWDDELWNDLNTRICDFMNSGCWQADLPAAIEYVETLITDSVVSDVNDRNDTPADFQMWVDTLFTFTEEREAYLRGELQCPENSPKVIQDTIHVYSDNGIPADTSFWNWPTNNPLYVGEILECTDAPEGERCYFFEYGSWIGGGVFTSIGQNNGYNLSMCDQLSFYLYVVDPNDEIKVEIQRTTSQSSTYTHTLSGLTSGWQSITLTFDDFGVSSTSVLENVFGIFLITVTEAGEFWIDDVKWTGCSE